VIALALSLVAATAAAETDAERAATEFDAGLELWDAGDHAGACAAFERSLAIVPSVGNLLNLGRCAREQGKAASALGYYRRAAELARSQGDAARAAAIDGLAGTLAPEVPELRLQLPAIAGLTLRLDGRPLDPASLPLALDAGHHELDAEAPGRVAWHQAFEVSASLEVIVPELEVVPQPAPPLVPAPPPMRVVSLQPPPPEDALAIAGFVVGGAGLVGLAVGLGLGGAALAARDDATALCPDQRCNLATEDGAAGRARIEDAEGLALGASVALGIGGVVAGAGIVMLLVDVGLEEDEVSIGPRGLAVAF
jgi:tetratricopeptide (TPR) repeat protein